MGRPTRQQLIRAAVPLAVVLVLALAAVVIGRPPTVAVASPSPTPSLQTVTLSPTPSPSASPSPSPSPVPTVATRQPTPAPTISYIAGTRMLPYYFEIRSLFALFPPAPSILPDEDAEVDENAAFYGLDAQGQPKFAVRHDFVIDKGTTAHEMGHAYQKILEAKFPNRDILGLYWTFRGFPGTWEQALAQSQAQPTYSGKWIYSPQESWAEAFRAAVMIDNTKEKTLDYGKTIDPVTMRAFFLSLAK